MGKDGTLSTQDLVAAKSDDSQKAMTDTSQAVFGGEQLRAAREKAGVDIATLSEELRIPKSYLSALETESYEELPGTTYGFGYIKSYCKFLEIDDTRFLDTYKMRTAVKGFGPAYHFPDEALEPRMSGAMTAMLGVLALLTIYIGWQIFDRFQDSPIAPSETQIVTTLPADEAATESSSKADAVDEIKTQQIAQNKETSQDVSDKSVEVTKTPSEATDAQPADSEQAPQAQSAQTVQTAQTDETTASETQPETQSAGVVQDELQNDDVQDKTPTSVSAQANVRVPDEEIVISAKSAAWVEVVSENGDVILSQLFQAGDDYVAPADQKLYLSTGNAGGLVLMIPGLDPFQAGNVGEIIRDLPLSRESIRSRRSSVNQ